MVDLNGNELQKSKSKEEVVEALRKVAPKNKEEEVLLARKIGEMLENQRRSSMNYGIDTGFGNTFKKNADKRANREDGFTDERGWRLIAEVPKEIDYVAQELFGEEFYKDRKTFKEAFTSDDVGKACLTVDPRSI